MRFGYIYYILGCLSTFVFSLPTTQCSQCHNIVHVRTTLNGPLNHHSLDDILAPNSKDARKDPKSLGFRDAGEASASDRSLYETPSQDTRHSASARNRG